MLVLSVLGLAVADLFYMCGQWRAYRLRERRGFTVQTSQAGGKYARYVCFRPHVPPPDGGYPVILFLNGQGENGHDGANQLSNNFGREIWETKRRFPFICVAVQCRTGGSWDPQSDDTRRALAVLDEVIEDYDANPHRVYLTGPSAGGAGVWRLATAFPDRFAAIVPVSTPSSGLPTATVLDVMERWGIAVWSTYNGGDSPGLVAFNRRLRSAFLDRGLSPMFSEFDREGHNAWLPTYGNPALLSWLLRQSQAGNEHRQQLRYSLLLDEHLSRWTQERDGAWSVAQEEWGPWVLSSSPPSRSEANGASGRILLQQPMRGDFDLHFDYAFSGNAACVVVIRGAGESSRGGDELSGEFHLVIERPERGSGGVFAASKEPWLSQAHVDPVGQRALRASEWNDVRIERREDLVTVRLNGWLLMECRLPLGPHVEVGFRSPDSADAQVKYRFIRAAGGAPRKKIG